MTSWWSSAVLIPLAGGLVVVLCVRRLRRVRRGRRRRRGQERIRNLVPQRVQHHGPGGRPTAETRLGGCTSRCAEGRGSACARAAGGPHSGQGTTVRRGGEVDGRGGSHGGGGFWTAAGERGHTHTACGGDAGGGDRARRSRGAIQIRGQLQAQAGPRAQEVALEALVPGDLPARGQQHQAHRWQAIPTGTPRFLPVVDEAVRRIHV